MKNLRLIIAVVAIFLYTSCYVHSNDKEKETNQQGTVAEQKESPYGTYKIRRISANLEKSPEYKKPSEGDPVEVVYEFLELNESSMQITNPRCELMPIRKTLEHYRPVVSFQQVYNGIPIQHTDITARFTYSGGLISIEGEYLYDINLPVIPPIDSASAVNLAVRALGHPSRAKVVAPSGPIIVIGETMPHRLRADRLYMFWIVEIFPDSAMRVGQFERFYINALKGTISFRETSSTLIHDFAELTEHTGGIEVGSAAYGSGSSRLVPFLVYLSHRNQHQFNPLNNLEHCAKICHSFFAKTHPKTFTRLAFCR